MNPRILIGLAVAALVALVFAVVINRSRQPLSESGADAGWLVPALHEHVNDVSEVVVTGAGNKTIATLKRGVDGWHLVEEGGYTVDTGKLRAFLLKLADARALEKKTAIKEKYALLGVEDVAAGNATGLQVTLRGLASPVALIIGNDGAHESGSFVRRAGDAQSWQASVNLAVDKTAPAWLDSEVTNIPAAQIRSLRIVHADGSAVVISKGSEGTASFTLADIPKGREAASEYSINALASTLDALHFEDVLQAKVMQPSDSPLKATFAGFNGAVVDITAWTKDDKHYAQFAATLDAHQADQSIASAQAVARTEYESATAAASKQAGGAGGSASVDAPAKPLAITDAVKDREDRLAVIKRKVADLNARFDGWTFVLPASKYANIDKSIEQLLKPIESESVPVATKKSAHGDKSQRSGRERQGP